jgi:hypothetical protein
MRRYGMTAGQGVSAYATGTLRNISAHLPCGDEYYSFHINRDGYSMEQLTACIMDPSRHGGMMANPKTYLRNKERRDWLTGYRNAF